MSSRQTQGCCSCSCLFSTAICAIFLWLALRILKPTCSIEEFDIFTLQNPPNNNNTIHYDLKLKNRNFNKGIYYDALNITFYYKPNPTFPIGNTTIDPFYQGFGKSTHRVGGIDSIGVNLSGEAVFRVEVVTAVRYKSPLWKTKRHRLMVGADLKVNGDGSLIKSKGNNGIKLSSGAKKSRVSFGVGGILGIFGLLLFI